MNMNSQSIWLVTMLVLMVVLSGYYLITGPVEPVNQTAQKKEDQNQKIEVNIKQIDQPTSGNNQSKNEQDVLGSKDYFTNFHLDRSTLREQMAEEYYNVLMNPNSSKQELQEAQQKLDELNKLDQTESVIEELIREAGYRDAVVMKSNNHVDVIVQADKLSNAQVVKLIELVRKQLNVSPYEVSVAYRD